MQVEADDTIKNMISHLRLYSCSNTSVAQKINSLTHSMSYSFGGSVLGKLMLNWQKKFMRMQDLNSTQDL
jgi:hypothetical protein